mmetsp:Transcript_37584/g.59309  ORF Transcript_37584/g.59309 Transcript_37584/m.59309 type:complete len:397 (-) Transcript_37584:58-1248(-)
MTDQKRKRSQSFPLSDADGAPPKQKMKMTDANGKVPDNGFLKTNMNLYKDSKIKQTLVEAMELAFLHHKDLAPSHFAHLDMLHYNGVETLNIFATQNKLNEGKKLVVDIGSGTGGPGRHLAWAYPVDVVGVEYNEELARVSSLLSRLLSIPSLSSPFPSSSSSSSSSSSPSSQCQGTFSVVVSDASNMDLKTYNLEGRADAIMTQLALLHISDKEGVLQNCNNLLKKNGAIWIEDYFIQGEEQKLSEFDAQLLHDEVGIKSPETDLLTLDSYKKYLEDAGFQIDEIQDETKKWGEFVWGRFELFLKKWESPQNMLTVSGGSVGGSSLEFRDEMVMFYFSVCLVLCPRQGPEEMMAQYPLAVAEGARQYKKSEKEFAEFLSSLPRTLGGVQIRATKK